LLLRSLKFVTFVSTCGSDLSKARRVGTLLICSAS
jgi:hypothetical protein